ncbi:MAG: hypothetical protein RL199_2073 [Pseudomonadota bacterium]|jgi:hypothetical protein
MRIRSVGHACLEIEAKDLTLLTDPWWAGPAYEAQWFPFPEPLPGRLEERAADYLYLSHGHEDHLHLPTLRRLPRSTTVLVPELLAGDLAPLLQGELGFHDVVVLRHGRTQTLRRGIQATCYLNATDSMLVLSDGDRVLVDANDALHASQPAVVDYFCRLLRERHPHIDTLFLGFAGASWAPNCLRLPGKDDRAEARAREEALVETFVDVVEKLRPRLACAFAASFALADPQLAWVNEVKLEVAAPDVAWRRRHPSGGTSVHLLLPGDLVDGVEVTPGPTPRPSRTTLAAALEGDGMLGMAVRARAAPASLTPERLRELAMRLADRAGEQSSRLWGRRPFEAELRLRDTPGTAIRLSFDGRRAWAALGPSRRCPVALELRAEILEAVLREPYGFEAVTIGYGAIARLSAPADVERVHDVLRLLRPRRPVWRLVADELARGPARLARSVWDQRLPLALALAGRWGLLRDRDITTRPASGEVPRRQAA